MSNSFNNLKKTIKRLRDPVKGCPWDRKQTYKTLLKYLISEVDELKVSIRQKDYENMKEELGDILLHVFLFAQIASEKKNFKIEDVFNTINRKLIRRHPHVFGKTRVNSIKDIITNWEKIKQKEKLKKLITTKTRNNHRGHRENKNHRFTQVNTD